MLRKRQSDQRCGPRPFLFNACFHSPARSLMSGLQMRIFGPLWVSVCLLAMFPFDSVSLAAFAAEPA